MKKLFACLFVLFTWPVFGQSIQPHILNDSSLCFVEQVKGGNAVELSTDELAEQLLSRVLLL